MQEINDVINFAHSMFERFPQQIVAAALFVLWFGLGFVGVVFSGRDPPAYLGQCQLELAAELSELESIVVPAVL